MTLLKAIQQQAAAALLDIDAVGFTPHAPVTFKSGITSPVYVDNRRLPFWPVQWHVVIDSLRELIALHAIPYEVLAGIAAAGIPHSAALAYALHVPSVFVRKEAKAHGTQSQIEGGDVDGKHVLLIEDLVTTGGSSLHGVEVLRAAGAMVTHCLCITSYDFAEAQEAFNAAHVQLHPLTPFAEIILEASKRGLFGEAELAILEAWMRDPHGWISARDAAEGQSDQEET